MQGSAKRISRNISLQPKTHLGPLIDQVIEGRGLKYNFRYVTDLQKSVKVMFFEFSAKRAGALAVARRLNGFAAKRT